eukprot:TRINITY_DN363_c0_g1_i6.p1 TRINITY_DN363_c0_g1~~TRINITY_DN363_c0_g1_i6.p1  ORF type:complete len:463 (+),score=104.66 TRINITY_DN363_c0_g1_i6:86-1390(+)
MVVASMINRRPLLLPGALAAGAALYASHAAFEAFTVPSTGNVQHTQTPSLRAATQPFAGKLLSTSSPLSASAFSADESIENGYEAPASVVLAATALAAVALRAEGAEGAAAAATPAKDEKKSLFHTLKLPIFVCLWYLFNIQYNIQNKKLLKVFDATWAVSWWQLAAGVPIALFMWSTGLLKKPSVTADDVKKLAPVGAAFSFGQMATVASLGAGAVSFTHVVKALEPALNAIASAFLLGQVFHPLVYASLIPVFVGVGMASASEMSFTMFAFGTAMMSNMFFVTRNVLATKLGGVGQMGDDMITRKTNQLCVLTMVATAVLFPVALCLPGGLLSVGPAWELALQRTSLGNLCYMLLASGFHFFMYQMSSFWVLSQVPPITHSVLNTLKRVVIIIVSILVFRNPVTAQGAAGTGVAIGGVLLYSLTKAKFSNKK